MTTDQPAGYLPRDWWRRGEAVVAPRGFWGQLWRALLRDTPAFRPHATRLRLHADPAKGRALRQELAGASREGASWILRAQLRGRDLMGADLSGMVLVGANLTETILVRADLTGARLIRVMLRRARLHHALLRRCQLNEADLKESDLRYADLSSAVLVDADLRAADLSGSNLSGANLDGAHLEKARLRGARMDAVRWTSETVWPQELYPSIRAESQEILPGVFQFGRGEIHNDRVDVH